MKWPSLDTVSHKLHLDPRILPGGLLKPASSLLRRCDLLQICFPLASIAGLPCNGMIRAMSSLTVILLALAALVTRAALRDPSCSAQTLPGTPVTSGKVSQSAASLWSAPAHPSHPPLAV